MKPKVIILQWLPASGKSTWAKEHCKKYPNFIRVNKDDIRAMMASDFSKPREEVVLAMRDQAIKSAIENWFWVVVDDTNFEQKHIDRIKGLSSEVEIKLFDTPLSVCIERNKNRENPVPQDVIESMARKYNVGKEVNEFEKVIQDPTLTIAVIVDIDWTIADHWERNPYDMSTVLLDKPIGDMIELVKVLSETYAIIFVSGRSDICEKDTFEWLTKYFPHMWIELLMRKEWDNRKDSIVKYEILQTLIKYNFISYVLDDRDQVVRMWREAWLRCLQVDEWNF